MKSKLAIVTLIALGLGAASSASALSFEADGTVTGWNIKPFTVASPGTEVHANGVQSLYSNNYSPINYPGGVGHQPSPGGSTGEKFDLEEMHVRQTGTTIEMLLVRSSPFQASASNTFLLGDILLDVNGDDAYDLGIISTHDASGLAAGGLYSIDTTKRLQNKGGSYYGHAIESTIGPWAVGSGSLLGQVDLDTASYTYPVEGLTWLTVYTFDLAWLGAIPDSINYHLVWGCGNDVIAGSFSVTSFINQPPDENYLQPQPPTTATPEPATAMLGLLSLAGCGAMAMRRRR